MSKYTGTQTEKNLLAAFAGESQARNKYTYFAQVAKKEGNEKIAQIFEKTAANEEQHAKMWLTELDGIHDSTTNLKNAADGENAEWTDMLVLQKQQKKKVLQIWHESSAQLQQLKNVMKNATVHF